MVRKKILKKLSYIGSAVILMLATVPIIPSGMAHASATCPENATELRNAVSQLNSFELCGNEPINLGRQGLTITRNVTIDLKGHRIIGNISISSSSKLTLNDSVGGGGINGNISPRNPWGTLTNNNLAISGGDYSFDPTSYLASGYYTKLVDGRYVVLPNTTVAVTDVVIPVGAEATEFFTVTPAGTSTQTVRRAGGEAVTGALDITTIAGEGQTVGKVVGVTPGDYEVRVTTESGDAKTANVGVYSYNQVADVVLPKDGSQNLTITTQGTNVNWTAGSSDTDVATVENGVINAVSAGKATITVTFADSLNTTMTFDVYVYDFDASDNVPLLIKKGDSAVVSTDSYWDVTASADDDVAEAVEGTAGKFTITGKSVGETEFTFTTTVNGENLSKTLSKTIKVYVYDVAENEIWINKGEIVSYDGIELSSDAVNITVESSDTSVADKTDSIYNIEGKSAGDATLTYKLMVDTRIVEVPVTVHVYSVSAQRSVTIVAGIGTTINNPAIAEIENASAIEVKVASGDEYISVDDYADGNLGTLKKGTAVIEFYAGTELVGTTEIKVYELQELADMVLSVSGTGASTSEVINLLEDVNLPSYRISISDRNIASISEVRSGNLWTGWTVTGHRITARGAGKAVATITYTDSLGETTETFDVYVSDYSTNSVDGDHDVAQGGTVNFIIRERYGQDSVTYADDLGFTISYDDNSRYIVEVPEDMAGGEYTLEFTDKVGGKTIATQSVKIRVHEITTSEDELFVKKDEPATITVKEKNDFAELCENVWHTDYWFFIPVGGHYEYECSVEVRDASGAISDGLTVNGTEGSDDYEIIANEAGEYTVTFSDGITTKSVKVYAIDFTVSEAEYHIARGDTTQRLVTALNKYWNETNKGATTDFVVAKDNDTDYYFWPTTAGAGEYELTFSALVNGEVRDTKAVKVYVYEMTTPRTDRYYGEMNGMHSFRVSVDDRINRTVEGMAEISYEIEGDASGIEINGNRVNVTKPGEYKVKYIDTMNHGNGGVVGEWTATFKVYNLDVEFQEDRIIDAGEDFEYTINANNTYGEIETVVTRDGEEIARATGTDSIDIDTTVEGRYVVRIENTAARRHGFREVESASFYVVAKEYDLLLLRSGEKVDISTESIWSVDFANDWEGNELEVVDGVVTVDTTGMDLGVYGVSLGHNFSRGRKETLKSVTIVIYDIEADAKTDPKGVTAETIESLIKSMLSADDWETTVAKLSEVFGEEDWLSTAVDLNINMLVGNKITTRVNVEKVIPEDEVRASILNKLAKYNVDHVDYYDVSVLMEANGELIGKVHQLNDSIVVAIAKAEDPATGYTRQYFVVRMHEGEEPEVLVEGVDFYIKDGIIYAISDKFSIFSVAYKDTLLPPKSPDTGAEVTESGSATVSAVSAIAGIFVAVTLAGVAALTKRQK